MTRPGLAALIRLLSAMALMCVATISTGCASQPPVPPQSTPSATNDQRCDQLGTLAPACGKTFIATRVAGGDTSWTDLPALQLTLSATPDDQTPYLAVKTGANTTMTRVLITADQLVPTEKTQISTVGHAKDAEAEAEREQWVLNFTDAPMRWALSPDRSQLTLTQGGQQIVAATT